MSGSMHTVGLFGSPRRTAYTTYGDHPDAVFWMPYHVAMAIGGTILFIGVILMFCNMIALMRAPKGDEKTAAEFPIGETADAAEPTPKWIERWGVWVGVLVVLILFAYTVPFGDMLVNPAPGSKPWVTW